MPAVHTVFTLPSLVLLLITLKGGLLPNNPKQMQTQYQPAGKKGVSNNKLVEKISLSFFANCSKLTFVWTLQTIIQSYTP